MSEQEATQVQITCPHGEIVIAKRIGSMFSYRHPDGTSCRALNALGQGVEAVLELTAQVAVETQTLDHGRTVALGLRRSQRLKFFQAMRKIKDPEVMADIFLYFGRLEQSQPKLGDELVDRFGEQALLNYYKVNGHEPEISEGRQAKRADGKLGSKWPLVEVPDGEALPSYKVSGTREFTWDKLVNQGPVLQREVRGPRGGTWMMPAKPAEQQVFWDTLRSDIGLHRWEELERLRGQLGRFHERYQAVEQLRRDGKIQAAETAFQVAYVAERSLHREYHQKVEQLGQQIWQRAQALAVSWAERNTHCIVCGRALPQVAFLEHPGPLTCTSCSEAAAPADDEAAITEQKRQAQDLRDAYVPLA